MKNKKYDIYYIGNLLKSYHVIHPRYIIQINKDKSHQQIISK